MLRNNFLPTNELIFRIKSLKVKLLAGEQKAIEEFPWPGVIWGADDKFHSKAPYMDFGFSSWFLLR